MHPPMAHAVGGFLLLGGSREGKVELLTAHEVAQLLKVKVGVIRELSRSRTQRNSAHPLPVVKFSKKCVRYLRADIEQWISEVAQSSQVARAGA
jgi:predicted DNA-binding transcriptional regulator AlpA